MGEDVKNELGFVRKNPIESESMVSPPPLSINISRYLEEEQKEEKGVSRLSELCEFLLLLSLFLSLEVLLSFFLRFQEHMASQ